MKWFIRAYTIILLLYTGARTFDFVSKQLPQNDTGFWLAVLFLFATEAGLLLWHEVSISHTTTFVQHGVATFLTWLDFAASLGAGIADMIIRQTIATEYTIPSWLAMALIFGLPAVVAINVAGALIFLQNDAEAQEDRATRFLVFEATRQAIKDLNTNRAGIAKVKKAEIAEKIKGDAMNQIEKTYRPAVNGKSAAPADPEQQPNPTKARKA